MSLSSESEISIPKVLFNISSVGWDAERESAAEALFYCVRSMMVLFMTILACGETSYISSTVAGSRIRLFLKSGSLAALSRISLIISASFSFGSKCYHQKAPEVFNPSA